MCQSPSLGTCMCWWQSQCACTHQSFSCGTCTCQSPLQHSATLSLGFLLQFTDIRQEQLYPCIRIVIVYKSFCKLGNWFSEIQRDIIYVKSVIFLCAYFAFIFSLCFIFHTGQFSVDIHMFALLKHFASSSLWSVDLEWFVSDLPNIDWSFYHYYLFSVPLVSRMLPSDVCKIYKKGSCIR